MNRRAVIALLLLTACSSPAVEGLDALDLLTVSDLEPIQEVRNRSDQMPPADILHPGDQGVPVDLLPLDLVDMVVPPDLQLLQDADTLSDPMEVWEVEVQDAPDILEVVPDLPPLPCQDGMACDDGDPCTVFDVCQGEECVGQAYECNDGRECTLDTCDGLGNCSYTLIVGKCLINGVCAKSGQKHPNNQCLFCHPAENPHVWASKPFAPCNDNDACTVNDVCVDGECTGEEALCNDGNPCTQDFCTPDFGCEHPVLNVPCDDGDPCTALDFCESGECLGGPGPPCNDNNPCTADSCQPGKGCFYMKLDGQPCDDDNACTIGDVCAQAECVPGDKTPSCDDFNDCTADICDPAVGCTYPLAGNPCCINEINICDDGDPCTLDDCNVDTGACIYKANDGACTDKNACTKNDICKNGLCQGEPVDCDDDSPCTVDFCHLMSGCQHEPVNASCDDGSVCTLNDQCVQGKCQGTKLNCNDYNMCTDDICDPVAGCQNTFNQAPCNDLDLCTANDHCDQGDCVGEPKTCDDGNPCTDDSCDPGVGCQNVFNSAACDDGDECTESDHCQGGVCMPGAVVCASCDYSFGDAVNRVVTMKISTDTKAGNALDLDGNGSLDNSMAGIGGLANEPLQDAVDGGSVHLLMEHHGIKTDGGVYTMAVFIGELAAGFENCDFTADYCGYVADSSAIDLDECEALVQFDNASIFQGKLVAGGMPYKFPWQIPLSEATVLDITLFAARIEATVTVQQGLVTKMTGVIGGAIPKESFVSALDAVPEESLPLPKAMIMQLIQGLVKNDIDTDGNGSPDAASIAIQFEAIPAGIVGMN